MRHTGSVWYPLNRSNVPAMHALLVTYQEAVEAPFRTSLDEIYELLDSAQRYEIFGTLDDEANLVSYGLVRMAGVAGSDPHIIISSVLSPDMSEAEAKKLSTEQLTQLISIAREMAVVNGVSNATAVAYTEEWDTMRAHLLLDAGFTHIYSYLQMRRRLDEEPVEHARPLPAGMRLVNVTEEEDNTALLAHNSFHDEKIDYPIFSASQWEVERSSMRRDWSYLLLDERGDRPRVAGYALASAYPQDWDALGWKEGYIDELAIHSTYSTDYLVTLLDVTTTAQHASGMEYSVMDVTIVKDPPLHMPGDQTREQSRLEVYRKLGFTACAETKTFMYQL
ncbi:hypothetical protein [Actinotignum urinale]|uniref:hypothetical protein n=1 Tax=Actinotignum urinale TaxID=190146 RepID=UPI00370D9E53